MTDAHNATQLLDSLSADMMTAARHEVGVYTVQFCRTFQFVTCGPAENQELTTVERH